MARKLIFTQEQLLSKTKDYIKEYGIEKMNARDLCKYIGCSTQPLFKNFDNMDNLNTSLKLYLHNYYNEYIDKIVNKEDYLYTSSYAYAMFSFRESNIFKALFMSDLNTTKTIEELFNSSQNSEIIHAISNQYGLTQAQSEKLYRDVIIYTHGLSCQIACRNILVEKKEIKKLINNIINNLKDVY